MLGNLTDVKEQQQSFYGPLCVKEMSGNWPKSHWTVREVSGKKSCCILGYTNV